MRFEELLHEHTLRDSAYEYAQFLACAWVRLITMRSRLLESQEKGSKQNIQSIDRIIDKLDGHLEGINTEWLTLDARKSIQEYAEYLPRR